MTNNRREI